MGTVDSFLELLILFRRKIPLKNLFDLRLFRFECNVTLSARKISFKIREIDSTNRSCSCAFQVVLILRICQRVAQLLFYRVLRRSHAPLRYLRSNTLILRDIDPLKRVQVLTDRVVTDAELLKRLKMRLQKVVDILLYTLVRCESSLKGCHQLDGNIVAGPLLDDFREIVLPPLQGCKTICHSIRDLIPPEVVTGVDDLRHRPRHLLLHRRRISIHLRSVVEQGVTVEILLDA